MRALSPVGIAIGLFMCVLAGDRSSAAGVGTVFHSAAGRFSVSAATAPDKQEQTFKSKAGTVTTHFFVFPSGRQVRMVSYSDQPSLRGTSAGTSRFLDGTREGVVTSVSGTLIKEKKLSHQSHPGRELWVEAKGGILMVLRSYVVGKRVYGVLVRAPKEEFREQEAMSFLNSFTLTR